MISISHLAADTLHYTSLYTSLAEKECRTVWLDEEAASSTQLCPGTLGHGIKVDDSDLRQTVTIITPDGQEHPLNYWHIVTRHFSTLGNKAEWRLLHHQEHTIPTALVVRVNREWDGNGKPEKTSYLSVSKITPEATCVTDVIPPVSRQNELAREAADIAFTKPCLPPLK